MAIISRYAGYTTVETAPGVPTMGVYFNTSGARQDYLISAVDVQTLMRDCDKFLKKNFPQIQILPAQDAEHKENPL